MRTVPLVLSCQNARRGHYEDAPRKPRKPRKPRETENQENQKTEKPKNRIKNTAMAQQLTLECLQFSRCRGFRVVAVFAFSRFSRFRGFRASAVCFRVFVVFVFPGLCLRFRVFAVVSASLELVGGVTIESSEDKGLNAF